MELVVLYDLYQQEFQLQTILGLLFGSIIGIALILTIIQLLGRTQFPIRHYSTIGALIGAGIGNFLVSLPARWHFLQLTHQLLTTSQTQCHPGCTWINYHYLALHSNYIIILGIPLIIALFLSLRQQKTRFQSNTKSFPISSPEI